MIWVNTVWQKTWTFWIHSTHFLISKLLLYDKDQWTWQVLIILSSQQKFLGITKTLRLDFNKHLLHLNWLSKEFKNQVEQEISKRKVLRLEVLGRVLTVFLSNEELDLHLLLKKRKSKTSFNKRFLQNKHLKKNKPQGSIKFHQKCPQQAKNLQEQFIGEIDCRLSPKQTFSLEVKIQNFDSFKRLLIISFEVNTIKCMMTINIKVLESFQKGLSILKTMMVLAMMMKENIIKKDPVKKTMSISGFKRMINKLILNNVWWLNEKWLNHQFEMTKISDLTKSLLKSKKVRNNTMITSTIS